MYDYLQNTTTVYIIATETETEKQRFVLFGIRRKIRLDKSFRDTK